MHRRRRTHLRWAAARKFRGLDWIFDQVDRQMKDALETLNSPAVISFVPRDYYIDITPLMPDWIRRDGIQRDGT